MGGNLLGYTFLLLMLLGGILLVTTTRTDVTLRIRLIRWVFALLSLLVVYIAGFGFGLGFAPGAMPLLFAAILS